MADDFISSEGMIYNAKILCDDPNEFTEDYLDGICDLIFYCFGLNNEELSKKNIKKILIENIYGDKT